MNHSPTHAYQQALSDATDALKAAHINAHGFAEVLQNRKRLLAERETELIRVGLEGKNEAARRAELDALTEPERANVQTAEDIHRRLQLNLTLAELDYKLARELAALHRAELTSRGGTE